MHRILALFVLLALASSTSHAILRLGVKGGVNLANVDADIPNQVFTFDTKIKPGIMAGAFAEVPLMLSGGMAVRGELLYVQKGTKYKISYIMSNADINVSEDELVLAPFLVWYFPVPKVSPFIEIGPEFGMNVRDRITADGGPAFDSNGNWNSTNMSLNFGGGVRFSVGTRNAHADIRYNLGLTDMGSWDPNSIGDVNTKTNGIQISAGVDLFRL
jgi:hypothetical protein